MMNLDWFQGETVVVVRETETGQNDKYGNPVKTTTETELEAVLAYRSATRSVGQEGTTYTNVFNLIFNQGADVIQGDTFIVRGEKYEADGDVITIDPGMLGDDFLSADLTIPIKKVIV